MKKIVILSMFTLLLIACSGEGKLKIINRTSNHIFFSVDNQDYVINGSENLSKPENISIKLDAGSDFPDAPQKTYFLEIEGETFAIYDYNQQVDVKGTEITIEADKTTSVYCDPNYACLRINNLSTKKVKSAYYVKSYNGVHIDIPQAQNLMPGASIYLRLEYALEIAEEPEDIFYYIFGVTTEDDFTVIYGNENNILYLDDVYELNIDQ